LACFEPVKKGELFSFAVTAGVIFTGISYRKR
jgi:hypothetical protein